MFVLKYSVTNLLSDRGAGQQQHDAAEDPRQPGRAARRAEEDRRRREQGARIPTRQIQGSREWTSLGGDSGHETAIS